MNWDIKKFSIGVIVSLAVVTILSVLISNYTDLSVVPTGTAYIIVAVSILLTYLFISVQGGFDKKEIWTMILLALMLVGVIYVLKHFIPEIFSAMPKPTQELFSALGV